MNPEGTAAQQDRYDDVSIVMITRNEEAAIGIVIDEITETLPGAEIVVVDGSTDQTPRIAREHGALVLAEPGGGPGPALHCALMTPERPIIGMIDADATYPVGAFVDLVRLVRSGFDLAGADRLGRLPKKEMPLPNWVANKVFAALASLVARKKLSDPHSGQRVYTRELLHRFDWDYRGLAYTVDLLFWPARAKCKIREIPIDYFERIGETKLTPWPGAVATFRRIFRRGGPQFVAAASASDN